MGWNSYHLRLANGKFTSITFNHSIKESVLVTALTTKLRDDHVDIDEVAAEFCRQRRITVNDPDPNQRKKIRIQFKNAPWRTLVAAILQQNCAPLAGIEAAPSRSHSPPARCYMCYMCYILHAKPLNPHSPPARCYMCYMCYILHAKPLNPHSPPRPCYMYYMCYILCTREICTICAI